MIALPFGLDDDGMQRNVPPDPVHRLRFVGAPATQLVQGVISGKPEDAAELGQVLADDLLARGAREILADVYGEVH